MEPIGVVLARVLARIGRNVEAPLEAPKPPRRQRTPVNDDQIEEAPQNLRAGRI